VEVRSRRLTWVKGEEDSSFDSVVESSREECRRVELVSHAFFFDERLVLPFKARRSLKA